MPTHAHAVADACSAFALFAAFVIERCAACSDGMAILEHGFVIASSTNGWAI
jgi:hypothetical protein